MKTIIVMLIITSATHDTAGHAAPECRLSGRMVDDRGGPLFGMRVSSSAS